MLKELAGSGDCHFRDLSNMSAIHFHIEGVPANAVALAVGAATVPAVAGIENTLVHFIRLAFDIIKERSDTDIVILPLPQYLDKFFGKLVVWHINRVAIAGGHLDEVTQVTAVFLSRSEERRVGKVCSHEGWWELVKVRCKKGRIY